MEMHTEGTTAKKGGAMRPGRHERHARGGAAKEKKVNEYNAQGSPEVEEAADEKPDFKRGGKPKDHEKRAEGGRAEGERGHKRHDKEARGKHREEREHHARGGRAGSKSPYSSGRSLTMGSGNNGHEGQKVPTEPE